MLGDRMIKQLLNSVIAKYRDLSVSRRSRYFAQPCPIIVNYKHHLWMQRRTVRRFDPYLHVEWSKIEPICFAFCAN